MCRHVCSYRCRRVRGTAVDVVLDIGVYANHNDIGRHAAALSIHPQVYRHMYPNVHTHVDGHASACTDNEPSTHRRCRPSVCSVGPR